MNGVNFRYENKEYRDVLSVTLPDIDHENIRHRFVYAETIDLDEQPETDEQTVELDNVDGIESLEESSEETQENENE